MIAQGTTKIYVLNQLKAIIWIKSAWKGLEGTKIFYVCVHNGLFRKFAQSKMRMANIVNADHEVHVQRVIATVVSVRYRMDTPSFLSPGRKYDAFEPIIRNELVSEVVSAIDVDSSWCT